MKLAHRVKPHIASLEPYQPGKPVEELERELGIEGALKLASNENPLGPSPRAVEAIRRAAGEVHLYPDGSCHALRRELASRLGVPERAVVFGTGSDEILELVAKSFLAPGDEAVHAWPSFAMYPIVIRGMGAEPVAVPLDARAVHDLDAMLAAVGPRTRVVFLCNPNNPTGTSVGAEAVDRFVRELPEDVVLVVDEAYVEYVRRPDFPDSLELVRRRPSTLVLRTFSKIYGLAGLRIGYGIGGEELVSYLERARHPFTVSVPAQAAALAALADRAHVERSRRVNAEGAAYLERELAALGLEVWPTDANFVLVRVRPGIADELLREGIIVRPMEGFGLPGHIRVTIGTPEQNRRLVETLRRLLGGRA